MRITDYTPKEDGYRMPGEFEEHDGTIMIYPTRPGSWGIDRSKALWAFGDIFIEILKRENLYLLAPREYWDEAREFMDEVIGEYLEANQDEEYLQETLEDSCLILPIDSDDAWARDVGPIFVAQEKRDIRAVNFEFNAWGGMIDGLYADYRADNALCASFCNMCEIDYYDAAPFVLEGGSICCDGEGTVMVTESCLLSEGRNPELTKEDIEDTLKEYLGAEKVLWLPRGIYNDETNEHVDNVCAFIRPGEVVLGWTSNEDDPQFEMSADDLWYLENETDAKGRKLKVHKLPIPDHPVLISEQDLDNFEFEEGEDIREAGERLAGSYVNFYFINGALLVPQFGGENEESDKRALEILKALLPDREVIGIEAGAILKGGGNIHCITQQIPNN